MRWLVIVLLVLGAHLSLTAIAPGEAGKALIYWPFAKDSRPTVDILGSATKPITLLLSAVAGLSLLAAAASLLGWLVPPGFWSPAVILGTASSALLFILYIGVNSLIPLAVDLLLLWGVLFQKWSVAGLRGL